MAVTILGEHPLARNESGELKCRIGTVFPDSGVVVTVPGIHATQRLAYVDDLNRQRQELALPPLTETEQESIWDRSVDLVMDDGAILIRPDPDNMDLAFRADETLQELVSKRSVKFLHVLNAKVRDAVKRRGECWRIYSLPQSADQMKRMIQASRIGIGGRDIYYHNRTTGTRYLTFQQFAALGSLGDDQLHAHLVEIAQFSRRRNRLNNPEVDFLATDGSLTAADFTGKLETMRAPELRAEFARLVEKFFNAVPPELRVDDPEVLEWRNRLFSALIGQRDDSITEEALLGLSSEFFMQVEWVPGGRLENGELIFDSVFDEKGARTAEEIIWDEKARGFIFNFMREYGDLEYINIGRVIGSLSKGRPCSGRRDVFIAQLKLKESEREILQIIRMQKWGVREHLDEGMGLLEAIICSEEYTDYILDRRLGCRQLGMNLPPRITARRIAERYAGHQKIYHGTTIWSPYFEREYLHGMATDKIPNCRLRDEAFSDALARLLGRAAAPNLIVGRASLTGGIIFDDGDEVVMESEEGLPDEIVVADHTGTFTDYRRDLRLLAADYARPVNRRAEQLINARGFATHYLNGFVEQFCRIQQEYRKRKRAFDTLFRHRRRDEAGSFAYRWEKVLERLNRSDALELRDVIAQNITL